VKRFSNSLVFGCNMRSQITDVLQGCSSSTVVPSCQLQFAFKLHFWAVCDHSEVQN
jgi:hypothetical protein